MEVILNESNAHPTVKDLHFRFVLNSSIIILKQCYALTQKITKTRRTIDKGETDRAALYLLFLMDYAL